MTETVNVAIGEYIQYLISRLKDKCIYCNVDSFSHVIYLLIVILTVSVMVYTYLIVTLIVSVMIYTYLL
jgi:hypothetical protein